MRYASIKVKDTMLSLKNELLCYSLITPMISYCAEIIRRHPTNSCRKVFSPFCSYNFRPSTKQKCGVSALPSYIFCFIKPCCIGKHCLRLTRDKHPLVLTLCLQKVTPVHILTHIYTHKYGIDFLIDNQFLNLFHTNIRVGLFVIFNKKVADLKQVG